MSNGPTCPHCGSPCAVTFYDGPGIAEGWRWCPVCHGTQRENYTVSATAVVKAANREHAEQIVSDALRGNVVMVNAEVISEPETTGESHGPR